MRLGSFSLKSKLLACNCARLSLSLFHEDRMRLGIASQKTTFSLVSALAFHYLCSLNLKEQHEKAFYRDLRLPDERGRQRSSGFGDAYGGYETCETLDEADAVFLNTCSVRDNAEQKIINRLEALHALRRKGRHLIIGVLGCMAERVKEELIENHHVDVVAGPDAYLSLPTDSPSGAGA